jgi:hypothetical protein
LLAQPRRQHEVCVALNAVASKPKEYLQYLQKVLQIIKTPIWQSKPILWTEIVALKLLSHMELEDIGVKQEVMDTDLVHFLHPHFLCLSNYWCIVCSKLTNLLRMGP